MARTLRGRVPRATVDEPTGPQCRVLPWVDGAPAEGYRAPRTDAGDPGRRRRAPAPRTRSRPSAILTGAYGARVLAPLLDDCGSGRRPGRDGRQPLLRRQRRGQRAHGGRGRRPGPGRRSPRAIATCCPTCACPGAASSTALTPDDLPRPVEIVATDGIALREALRSARASRDRRTSGRGHRRSTQRRQVDADEPHRRSPRGHRRGSARRHPRPQGASTPSGRAAEFALVDTGGLDGRGGDALDDKVSRQSEQAMADADVVLFVVDGTESG